LCWAGRKAGRPHFPPGTRTKPNILNGLSRFGKYSDKDAFLGPIPAANGHQTVKIEGKEAIMRIGKYQSSDDSGHVGTAITFLLIGIGAGALTALLFAPKTGKHLRRDLRRRYEGVRDSVEEWTEEAKEAAEEAYERGSDFADDVRERIAPIAKAIRR
jgi:gas vesicle protein